MLKRKTISSELLCKSIFKKSFDLFNDKNVIDCLTYTS